MVREQTGGMAILSHTQQHQIERQGIRYYLLIVGGCLFRSRFCRYWMCLVPGDGDSVTQRSFQKNTIPFRVLCGQTALVSEI